MYWYIKIQPQDVTGFVERMMRDIKIMRGFTISVYEQTVRFGDIVRSRTGAAHSRVVACLRSPSEMGGLLAGYIQSRALFFIARIAYCVLPLVQQSCENG